MGHDNQVLLFRFWRADRAAGTVSGSASSWRLRRVGVKVWMSTSVGGCTDQVSASVIQSIRSAVTSASLTSPSQTGSAPRGRLRVVAWGAAQGVLGLEDRIPDQLGCVLIHQPVEHPGPVLAG